MDILIYLVILLGLVFVIWKAVSIHLHNEAMRDNQLENQRRRISKKNAQASWIEPSNKQRKTQEIYSVSPPGPDEEDTDPAAKQQTGIAPRSASKKPAPALKSSDSPHAATPSAAVETTPGNGKQLKAPTPHDFILGKNTTQARIKKKPLSASITKYIAKKNADATGAGAGAQKLRAQIAEQKQKEHQERNAAEKKKQEQADKEAAPSIKASDQSNAWRAPPAAKPQLKAPFPPPAALPKDGSTRTPEDAPEKLTSKITDSHKFNLDEDGFLAVSSNAVETIKETVVVAQARHDALLRQAEDEHRLLAAPHANLPEPEIRKLGKWLDSQMASIPERKPTLAKESPKLQSTLAKNSQARWIERGERVEVGGVTIRGGLFYFGKKLDTIKGYPGTSDAALVNPGINITPMPMTYNSGEMGYWPSFNGLRVQERGAYISWLASDRSNPDANIGYVFLYYYGLERKVIHDNPALDVKQQIFDEVLRLLSIYGDNYSFHGYATELLEWIALTNIGRIHVSSETIIEYKLNNISFGMIGLAIKNKELINEDLALLWFLTRSRGISHKRAPHEYEKLFKIRYRNLFGEGLLVKENKKRLIASYFPASPTLTDPAPVVIDICDVSQIQGPMNKMEPIGESCRDDLLAYGRAAEGDDWLDNPALKLSLLPNELIDEETLPELNHLRETLLRMASTDGLVPVAVLWSFLHKHNPLPTSLRKTDLTRIEGLLNKLGYGYAPNPNLHYFKPQPDSKIALYPLHSGIEATQSNTFGIVLSTIWLGSAIAAADDVIHEKEISLLQRMVQNHEELTPQQKPSLLALLQWQVNSAVSKSKADLKKTIDGFPAGTKQAIGNMLVEVALADGTLSTKEMKELERLYRGLGLDTSSLASKVHSIGTQGNHQSHTHTYGPKDQPGTDAQSKSVPVSQEFKLDASILAKHESDTAEVQGMLGKIFTAMETEVAEQPEPETGANAIPQASLYPGIDPALSHVLDKIVTNELWTGSEIEDMCKEHGLMVGAALEAINDWAFETVDEALIDTNDDGSIEVEMDIAAEVLKLREDA